MKLTRIALMLSAMLAVAASKPTPVLTIASDDFKSGATLAAQYANDKDDCGGKNVSPELHWSGAPDGTKSFALTLFDPDAGHGRGFWHWVVYGIDPKTGSIAHDGPVPGTQGMNEMQVAGYGGPCPPVGDTPHHYIFTIYALDETVTGSLDGPALLKAIDGHVLAKAEVVGRFGR